MELITLIFSILSLIFSMISVFIFSFIFYKFNYYKNLSEKIGEMAMLNTEVMRKNFGHISKKFNQIDNVIQEVSGDIFRTDNIKKETIN